MTSAALQIDQDLLDELFSNQKKLDDMVLFDDEFLFGSSSSTTKSNQSTSQSIDTFGSQDDLKFSSDDTIADVQSRNIMTFVAPITLELIALYYAITYFS